MVLKKNLSVADSSRFEQFEDEFQFKFYRVLPDLKRFALPQDAQDTEQDASLDKQMMNLKVSTTIDELKKKM